MAELDDAQAEAAYQSALDGHALLSDTNWAHEAFMLGWNAALEDRDRLRKTATEVSYEIDRMIRINQPPPPSQLTFWRDKLNLAALEARDG